MEHDIGKTLFRGNSKVSHQTGYNDLGHLVKQWQVYLVCPLFSMSEIVMCPCRNKNLFDDNKVSEYSETKLT